MNILIIGGTRFLGRYLTEIALERGHTVTLFNRGKSNPDLFPEVEKIIGNREMDLPLLENRSWDAVIDPSGYLPRVVRESAQLLANQAKHYTFISSISVYKDLSIMGLDESAEVLTLADLSIEEVTGETYGPLKYHCEQEVLHAFPAKSLVVRPGLIVGPHDPTDRFTYWASRLMRGGEILAPGNPEAQVQFIDVRDLAKWILEMVERHMTGVFQATGPAEALSMQDFLLACEEAAVELNEVKEKSSLVWVNEDFLLEKGVGFWMEVPLWIPEREKMSGMLAVNCQQAIEQGLVFRPIAETIRDTIIWERSRNQDEERKAGLAPEKEEALLAEWQKMKV